MGKHITAHKEVTVKQPSEWHFTCDTCGYTFKKGERKVTYYSSGEKGKKYGCNDKPCTPFSNPKDYEYQWDIETRRYVWVKIAAHNSEEDKG